MAEIFKISTLDFTDGQIGINNEISLPEGVTPIASISCDVNGVEKLVVFTQRITGGIDGGVADSIEIDSPIFIITLGENLSISEPIIYSDILGSPVNPEKSLISENGHISFIGIFVKESENSEEFYKGIATIKILENDEVEFKSNLEKTSDSFDIYYELFSQELQFVEGDYLHIIPTVSGLFTGRSSLMTYDIKLGKKINGSVEFVEKINSSIGIFENDGLEGDFVNVVISGIYENKNLNLVPGKIYYFDEEGNLTTSKVELETKVTTDRNTGIDIIESSYLRIGKSISSDKISLNIGRDFDYNIYSYNRINFPRI